MSKNWVLIEDDIKILLLLRSLVNKLDYGDRVLVLPFKKSKVEFLDYYKTLFNEQLPEAIEVGDEVQRFDDIKDQINTFGDANLLVLLDVLLATKRRAIQDQDMLLDRNSDPHNFWVGLLKNSSNVLVVTSASASSDQVVKAIKNDHVYRCDSVCNAQDNQGASELIGCAIKCWDSVNDKLHIDERIDSLLRLYEDCWINKWDDWNGIKAFGHDWFNLDKIESKHARSMMEWLGLQKNEYDSNAMKTLFKADWNNMPGNEKPERSDDCRDIPRKYLSAALNKFGIQARLQEEVEAWRLPFCPGIGFLISLKEFLLALVSDHDETKPRHPPLSVEFQKTQSEAENEMLCFRISIQLDGNGDSASRLWDSFNNGKNDGAAGALRNLVAGHAGGIIGNRKWDSLFRSANLSIRIVDYKSPEGCVELYWC